MVWILAEPIPIAYQIIQPQTLDLVLPLPLLLTIIRCEKITGQSKQQDYDEQDFHISLSVFIYYPF